MSRKLIVAALVFAVSVTAQQPSPEVQKAFGMLQSGDAAGAVRILEDVTQREPKNVRALRVLGAAYIRTKDYDKAINVLGQSLQIEPNAPAALYNTGVAYALKGDKDAAFPWLQKAKATGQLDMTQIQTDADLTSVTSDPRFNALLPTPEEFQHPFVEDVKIIHEFDGEAIGDQFGWIARKIGDVDGDHVADFVTSAPTNGAGGAKAGRIYVYSSKTGKLLWTANGRAGDQLGTGVEAAGDTNGDGIPDVIASGPNGGIAHIYSGKDGRILKTFNAETVEDDFG